MIVYPSDLAQIPKSAPATHAVDLSSRRMSSLMNVLVFTPYAVYLARGQMPPVWLIAASLVWTGINFFDDLKYLIEGEQVIESELSAPRGVPIAAQDAWRYRVNR